MKSPLGYKLTNALKANTLKISASERPVLGGSCQRLTTCFALVASYFFVSKKVSKKLPHIPSHAAHGALRCSLKRAQSTTRLRLKQYSASSRLSCAARLELNWGVEHPYRCCTQRSQ
jgi:hypothetical protein